MTRPATLRRTLGLPALVFYGVGCILGAGVYSVVGVAAGHAQESLWLSFLLASLGALFTGLSYVELATMLPRAAAEYVYARAAFPRVRIARFGVGSLVALSDVATAATVSLAFAGYLAEFVEIPRALAALGLVVLCTALNIAGVELSSRFNAVFTSIEVAGLAIVVAAGAAQPEFGAAILSRPPAGVLAGAALLFYAFLGFEGIANLAEEARRPARDLPRAVLVSIAVSTVLYVLVALAAVALVSPQELAGSDSPLATAVAAVSPRLAGALGGIALFATANTALIAAIVGSRLLFGMARGGDMPRPLARLTRRRRAPWAAALVVGAAAAALVPLGELEVVASLSSIGALVAFAAVNLALIVLRYRAPRRERPFRVPVTVGRLSVPAALGVVCTLALVTQFEASAYLAAAVAAGLLAVVFASRRWWARRA